MCNRKDCTKRIIIILIITCLATLPFLLICCDSGSSQPTRTPSSATSPSPEASAIDGAMLLDTRCSRCHSANRPKQARKTREEWEKTVTRMIGKGALLNETEKTELVDYLAKIYGP